MHTLLWSHTDDDPDFVTYTRRESNFYVLTSMITCDVTTVLTIIMNDALAFCSVEPREESIENTNSRAD